MVLCLVGKGGSGKDSILTELVSGGKFKRLATLTTRPKRQNEKDGVEYQFVTDDEFNKLKSENKLLEYRKYLVASGEIWQYGTLKSLFYPKKNDTENSADYAIILTPTALKAISEEIRENMIVINIHVDTSVIQDRMLKRGDNIEEIKRRMKADFLDFLNVEECVDYTINNNGELKVKDIADVVDLIYRKSKQKRIEK